MQRLLRSEELNQTKLQLVREGIPHSSCRICIRIGFLRWMDCGDFLVWEKCVHTVAASAGSHFYHDSPPAKQCQDCTHIRTQRALKGLAEMNLAYLFSLGYKPDRTHSSCDLLTEWISRPPLVVEMRPKVSPKGSSQDSLRDETPSMFCFRILQRTEPKVLSFA